MRKAQCHIFIVVVLFTDGAALTGRPLPFACVSRNKETAPSRYDPGLFLES
nr:MAG TPA: hypothetical protein [Caudoviricetes sp.]